MALLEFERSVQAALELVRPGEELRVPLLEAKGGFLARAVVATRPLPPTDNSAMDGYAVRSADIHGATRDTPARLRVVETVFAGGLPTHRTKEGEATRIFTGAVVPEGADAVVRQEATFEERGEVFVYVDPEPGEHIRRAGEEIEAGVELFPAGERLTPATLGLLAAMGLTHVPTRRRPNVAVVTLGDELVPPGSEAQAHQVFDSNGVFLAALLEDAGGTRVALEHVGDEENAIRETFQRLLPVSDMLVTCGGASVGQKDRTKHVLRSMGATFAVDGVAMKPGKPLAVGRLGRTCLVVLPGNPGAAAVGFDKFARPMLFRLQGAEELRKQEILRLDSERQKQAGLTYFLSATVDRKQGELGCARIRPQGPGQLLHNVGAEGWVLLPPGREHFGAGETVLFEHFFGATFRAAGVA